MSSAAASPAKTSALQGGAGIEARAADYGQNTPDLLANYDPATSSWRTSQHSLLGGLDEFSETWPRSGTMRSGIAYQLPPLVPLTAETASGLWPTPAVVNAHLGLGELASLVEEMPRLSLKDHMAKHKRAKGRAEKLKVISTPSNVTPLRKGKRG
jgi:hypothetical protein